MVRQQWRHGLIPWLLSRKVGFFLCVFGFLCTMTMMNMAMMNPYRTSDALKEEIVQLSEEYVKTLARENQDIIDGPYAGRYTGYDLKQTLAVLLNHILDRVNRIEQKVEIVAANISFLRQHHNMSTFNNITSFPYPKEPIQKQQQIMNTMLSVQDLIKGNIPDCSLPDYHKSRYPSCEGKIEYMRRMWKSDPCYAHYGVDGSDCSFIVYLSEVETWCPRLPWREKVVPVNNKTKSATFQINLQPLLDYLHDPSADRHNYAFIRNRIISSWSMWVKAALELKKKNNVRRTKKQIILHLGLLSKASGFRITEFQGKGGPLGELVQWSDLITSLYILGHDVKITSELDQLQNYLLAQDNAQSVCQSHEFPIDLVYTDIMGILQIKRVVKDGYGKFSCLLRVVDSFGTQPAFNFEPYAKKHKLATSWGKQNLHPQQFFTMFPHSPDNSFLGFVISQSDNFTDVERKNQALVYGKREEFWKGKQELLDVVHEFIDIHATVFMENGKTTKYIPPYIINHNILTPIELQKLLRQTKIFVGLGFPFEGPAPLEAIAAGCIFIQPKFKPPLSSRNHAFFKGKPTFRELTSQHPYTQDFIGEPNVYTLDTSNKEEIRKAIRRILNTTQVVGFMPYEFTEEGMLQRINAYIERQDFCHGLDGWVPESAIQIHLGKAGESCKTVCQDKGLICEPSHFPRINNGTSFQKFGMSCQSTNFMDDTYYPAYDVDKKSCVLQNEHMLFSCVTEKPGLQRLCSCRDFIKGQSALCHNCL